MSKSQQIDNNKQGYVINIQHYSVHDGPGIRTLVFLKGCPLQCKWCSNPESQRNQAELAYKINKCIGTRECTKCLEACHSGAIKKSEDNKILIDRNLCEGCHSCVDSCPSKALSVFGKLMSVNEVLKIVEGDSIFYSRSGGGLTLSGGEPLQQASFTIELLKEAKKRRINTSMETCGYTDWHSLENACEFLDTILFDIKCINEDKHIEFTKVSNKIILSNFIKLCERFPSTPKLVRTPVIPGFNDSEEDILEILDFIKGRPNVNYELLTYHRLGQPKYEYIGREYPMGDVKLDEEKMKLFKDIAQINDVAKEVK